MNYNQHEIEMLSQLSSEKLKVRNFFQNADQETKEEYLSKLTEQQMLSIKHDWDIWARPKQLFPRKILDPNDPHDTIFFCGGRGAGKTRTGSEWINMLMTGPTPLSAGRLNQMILIGDNYMDLKASMIEDSKSGILGVAHKDFRPTYNDNSQVLTWPNGAQCHIRHDRSYENIRGLSVQCVFFDEFAKYKYIEETYDMAMMANREKPKPFTVITTTPRPIQLIRDILANERTIVISSTTKENSDNLAPNFIRSMEEKYKGTRQGLQELEGMVLDDIKGALWNYDMFQPAKMPDIENHPLRIVVAVDPSTTSKGDECGIVICAKDLTVDNKFYVLEDASFQGSPSEWASKVISKYNKWGASRVIVEVNQGGDMVEEVLRSEDANLPIKKIHASKGKITRAEPVAALYEQRKVYHCYGSNETSIKYKDLESELVSYTGEGVSPNRMDALVYGLTELRGKAVSSTLMKSLSNMKISGFYD